MLGIPRKLQIENGVRIVCYCVQLSAECILTCSSAVRVEISPRYGDCNPADLCTVTIPYEIVRSPTSDAAAFAPALSEATDYIGPSIAGSIMLKAVGLHSNRLQVTATMLAHVRRANELPRTESRTQGADTPLNGPIIDVQNYSTTWTAAAAMLARLKQPTA